MIDAGFNLHKVLNFTKLQNPPWQYIESNETGIVGKARGVIIDILDEMSKKLNFTYVLHVAQASTNINSTDDVNGTVSYQRMILICYCQ